MYSRCRSSSNALKLTLLPSRFSITKPEPFVCPSRVVTPEFLLAEGQHVGKLGVGRRLAAHEMDRIEVESPQTVVDVVDGGKPLAAEGSS